MEGGNIMGNFSGDSYGGGASIIFLILILLLLGSPGFFNK